MSQRVVLATQNAHKLEELARIVDAAGLSLTVVGLGEFSDLPRVVETESTFEGNAALKAVAYARHTGLPCIADDSGLCVDALNGMPGVLSARWSGSHGNDRANLELVLAQVEDVPIERLTAAFVCAAVVSRPDGTTCAVEGRMSGRLIREPRGVNGFGYDPIFVPDGYAETSAELSAAQKDAISHRGQALRALLPLLGTFLVEGV